MMFRMFFCWQERVWALNGSVCFVSHPKIGNPQSLSEIWELLETTWSNLKTLHVRSFVFPIVCLVFGLEGLRAQGWGSG